MIHTSQFLRVAWFLCVVMVLWTTETHAQVIRTGGGNDLNASQEEAPASKTQNQDPATASFQLEPGYPNPFNPSTQIRYVLQTQAQVQLDVYNLLGQHVRTLAQGWQEAGVHHVQWDARNTQGAELAGGVYLIRLVVQNTVQTRTVVFQK